MIKEKETSQKTCFGVTRKEFEKKHEETKGFNETLSKDNLQKTRDDFNEFMIRASKGFSKTLAKNKQMKNSL